MSTASTKRKTEESDVMGSHRTEEFQAGNREQLYQTFFQKAGKMKIKLNLF